MTRTRPTWPPPEFPFAPARVPFFYGWAIVAMGTLAVAFSIPGQTMGVSVFTDPMLEATGMSRLQFSTAYLIGTLTSGFALPFGGRLLDRLGVRVVGFGAAMVLAAILVVLSFVGILTPRITPNASQGATLTAIAILAAMFAVLRFSGQGMLTLSGRTMVARWFDRRRGVVAATSGAFVSFAFSLAPTLLVGWIAISGWRGAWREMAIALVAMAVVALLFFRDTPEECGLTLDGVPAQGEEETASKGTEAPASRRPDATRAEALRTRSFWVLTLVLATNSMMGTALTFHIVDLGALAGLTELQTVRFFIPISAIAVTLGFLVGWLIDRQPVLRLVRAMAIFEIVMVLGAAHLEIPWSRALAIAAWGCVGGFYGPLTVAALPRLYGRKHLGAISGAMTMALVLASALGPAYLAWFRDATGSYQLGLQWSALIPLTLLGASFLVRRRGRPP